MALVVGGSAGSVDSVEEVGVKASLSAMLTGGSLWVMDTKEEKAKGNKSEVVEEMQERDVPGSN